MAWCQAAAPFLLPASSSLPSLSVTLKLGLIGLIMCRSLWPQGLYGGWAGRLSPATAVVKGYVGRGGVGWGSCQDLASLASSPETGKRS